MSPQKRKNKKAEKSEAERQRPSIKGTGASLFFPSSQNNQKSGRADDGRTDGGFTVEHSPLSSGKASGNNSRTTVEQPRSSVERVAKYRQAWKKEGLTQMSIWLPERIVERLKIHAVKEKRTISALCAEILGGKKYD